MTISPHALSVLVVDDEADAAYSLAQLLAFHGFASRAVQSAHQAHQVVADHPPDVILLDIQMPGVDGWTFAAQLIDCPKPPVIVAITGCGTEEDHRRSQVAGIDLHLVKPVDPGLLVGMLRRFERVLAPTSNP